MILDRALLAASLLLAASCSSTPEAPQQAEIRQEVQIEALVTAVDSATREVTLRGPDGSTEVVVAGPEVRNFDQIEVGKRIRVTYVEQLDARRLDADEADVVSEVVGAAARAQPGEKPGAGIAAGVAIMVTVQSVDVENHTVVFIDAIGEVHAARAQREKGKAFVAGLKPGDRVELAYGRALLLTLE